MAQVIQFVFNSVFIGKAINRKAISPIALGLIGVALLLGPASGRCAANEPVATAAPAPAEDWQREFDEICSRTQEAMSLSSGELTALVQRCDALLPRIEKLDETRKKVYTERLRRCKGLYAYVLESKKNAKD